MAHLLEVQADTKQQVGEVHSRLAVSFVSLKPLVAPNVVDLMHQVSVATSSDAQVNDFDDWLLACLKSQTPRLDVLARFLLRIKSTTG